MTKGLHKFLTILTVTLGVIALGVVVFCLFVDEAVFVRDGAISSGPTDRMAIALTFDDGPSPEWTPGVLDVLKDMDVKATFFVIGEHVLSYPELTRRIAREGHEIENHTHRHPLLFFRSNEDVEKEIRDCETAVRTVTGTRTKYFRPPRAWLTKKQRALISQDGYRVVLWSLNSKDWVTFDDKYVVPHVLRRVRPGDIILFHDSGGIFGIDGRNREETVKTVAQLIPKLKERGYQFVTVAELLGDSGASCVAPQD